MEQQEKFEAAFLRAMEALDKNAQKKVPQDLLKRCEGIRTRIITHRNPDAPFQIVFCGGFSAGKTSLINALLMCNEKLPTGINPITKVVTQIQYGKHFTCSCREGNTIRKLDTDEANRVILGEQAENVDELVIQLPSEILARNVEFLDTPGFEDEMGGRLEAVSREAILRADMAVICCNAVQLSRLFERSLLDDLENTSGNFCLVVNRVDNLNTQKDYRDIEDKAHWLMLGRGGVSKLPEHTGRYFLSVSAGKYQNITDVYKFLNGIVRSMQKRRAIRCSTDRMSVASCAPLLCEALREADGIAPALQNEIRNLEAISKNYCPGCGDELSELHMLCPRCGRIHPARIRERGIETREKLEAVSKVFCQDNTDYSICWDLEARRLERVLSKVQAIADEGNLPGITEMLRRDLSELIVKCANPEFQIAIVGIMKAGKSSLMNALMGVNIASVNVNPETAALTKFRSNTSGYALKVSFATADEWVALCESAKEAIATEHDQADIIVEESQEDSTKSLSEMLNLPETQLLSTQWIGHESIRLDCNSIEELRTEVAHWTSSHSLEHLFVTEVEAFIDRKVFDMPEEVVFVDTPGLQDPVQYRSDITRSYIKNANAVLIAMETKALTAEGLTTITKVLDYIGSARDKAYIIATKRDRVNSFRECEQILDAWADHLKKAKRYQDRAEAQEHIISTTSYQYLLLRRLLELSDEQVDDPEAFTLDEYSNLESYVKRVQGKRSYDVMRLRDKEEDRQSVLADTGIEQMKNILNKQMISHFRELKRKDLQEDYLRCRTELLSISKAAAKNNEDLLRSIREGEDALREHLAKARTDYDEAVAKNAEIRRAAEALRRSTAKRLSEL